MKCRAIGAGGGGGLPFIKLFTISLMRLMMMMRVRGDIIITGEKIIFTTKSKQNHWNLPAAAQAPANWKGQVQSSPVQCGPRREKKSKISVLFGILARSGWFLSQLLISELKYKSVNFQFSQISRFLRLATNLNETDGAIWNENYFNETAKNLFVKNLCSARCNQMKTDRTE